MTDKADPVIQAFKGFDKNMQCRGYQFEAGKTFNHEGSVKACSSGFHSCENPLDVFGYYQPGQSRFAIVEASGEFSRETNGDSKIASASLHIKAELTLPEFIGHAISWVTAHCTPGGEHATGDRSASSATGYSSASSATGDRSASSATGDSSASSATGYSSASSATGDRSASSATGYSSASSATGTSAVALNTGRHGRASASEGAAIVLCSHNNDGTLRHIRCSKVGENGIKPDTFYTLSDDGEFVEWPE